MGSIPKQVKGKPDVTLAALLQEEVSIWQTWRISWVRASNPRRFGSPSSPSGGRWTSCNTSTSRGKALSLLPTTFSDSKRYLRNAETRFFDLVVHYQDIDDFGTMPFAAGTSVLILSLESARDTAWCFLTCKAPRTAAVCDVVQLAEVVPEVPNLIEFVGV